MDPEIPVRPLLVSPWQSSVPLVVPAGSVLRASGNLCIVVTATSLGPSFSTSAPSVLALVCELASFAVGAVLRLRLLVEVPLLLLLLPAPASGSQ
ncbi:MAG: hypothetical protein P8019_08835 [Gammaproteobacteria bacterium]